MTLRDAWADNARDYVAWTRTPGADSYERFHRDQFLPLLPAPRRLTVDIGCGEGRLARDLKARGHRVVGIDGSPTLIAHARAADPEIEFHLADAAALPLDAAVADLAVAFLSLQDMDRMPRAIAEVARVLAPGGRFCFAIVHPVRSAGRFAGRAPDSRFEIVGSYLEPFRFVDPLVREGVAVDTHSEHRPLAAYFAALEDAGMLVEGVREPPIPEHAIAREADRRWLRLPLFLHVRAQVPGGV
jgi:SAM-dependent methyltransferase